MNKNKPKWKSKKQGAAAKKSFLGQEKAPCLSEINTLIALFTAGRYMESIAMARTMTERFPRHGFSWKVLGVIYNQLGRFDDALAPMQKAATLLSSDAEVYYNLGNILYALGRLGEAEASYRRAQQIKPDYAAVHYNLGNILYGLARWNEAEASYRRALQSKPDYAEAHNNLGNVLNNLGRLEDAAACYRRALNLTSGSAEAHNNLGTVLQNLGRLEEAVASYRRALEIKPDYAEAHNNLGNVLNGLGRLDDAVASYCRALELKPDYAKAYNNLGNVLQKLGRLEDAVTSYRCALVINADFAEAHHNLGIALENLGRLDEAEASYCRALEVKTDYAEAHNNLGNVLQNLGRPEDAAASYRRALQIKADSAEAHNNLGNTLNELGQFEDAVASYRRALEVKPDYAEAHNNLGIALENLGRLDEAMASYRRALEIKADYAEEHNNLGVTLNNLGRLEEAVASYRRALDIKPDYAAAYGNLGTALKNLGRLDDAVASYRRALDIKPDFAEVYNNLGNVLKDLGRLDDAVASYRRALELKPDYFEAHRNFILLKSVTPEDKSFLALVGYWDAIRNSNSSLPGKELIPLHFALGKCYDDIGDYEKAFPHFLEGCKLKRATFGYNPDRAGQELAGIIDIFDRATIDRLRGSGDPSRLPVFILGMPRSGTTLIEQMIASHMAAHGAGELSMLIEIMLRDNGMPGVSFPENLLPLTRERLTSWGEEYIAKLKSLAPDAQRITDKLPGNFIGVGLIHLMLPNAKIIHVNRNPMDTCLSCFTELFACSQEFSYDLDELGRYYADYARLMAHWRNVLPAGAFLDVNYEDIVNDTEAQARRIIEYCGLEWRTACLDFHKKERPIQTASAAQVRQPIYKSSIERWRHYEKFLGPLQDALNLHTKPADTGAVL
ncbi:tetratricopeptide repeat protein [Candidatus Methylospira mobilis]|uniref:Tetratricopeptide repeat protein n=1 Tax=Candidatus Methylospira mobilis TaxID=1808979 RepID=A0A5Q0BQR6_9GAMM|nr:tetratricopeptide repeat-containing sulfotransferase family protein [Candidatus Methylospira mobilis]QFY44428.1 tetratricopeptide repeat protein [Candidatus Methylospira mobilis]